MNETTKQAKNMTKDTGPFTTWQQYIDTVKSCGFEIGYRKSFESSDGKKYEEIIFYDIENGLILYAVGGTYAIRANLYGEIKLTVDNESNSCCGWFTDAQWEVLKKHCRHLSKSQEENGTWSFHLDTRYGFREQLSALLETFDLSKTWSIVHFLWFVNFMEENAPNYDYNAIALEKIEACNPEVGKIIFG